MMRRILALLLVAGTAYGAQPFRILTRVDLEGGMALGKELELITSGAVAMGHVFKVERAAYAIKNGTLFDRARGRIVGSEHYLTKPFTKDELLGGHAVLAVGYDDAKQVFIVRNSWGPKAQDKGYFKAEGLDYEFRELVKSTAGQIHQTPDKVGAFQSLEAGRKSDISCACHWTVNNAAANNIGTMYGKAYVVTPGGIMVPGNSAIKRAEDLKGKTVAVTRGSVETRTGISSPVTFAVALFTSATTTAPPRFANSAAVAFPIPDPPPVTRATFPEKSISLST